MSYILLQDYDGIRKPVYYGGRKFRGAEQRYGVRDQECLAIDEACKFYKPYVQSTHFTIQTDHRNLLYLKAVTPEQRRLYNYAVRLNTYDFELEHHAGSSMHDADHMSRHSLPIDTEQNNDDDNY